MSFVENKIALNRKLKFLIEVIIMAQDNIDAGGTTALISDCARREAAILQLNLEGYSWDPNAKNAYIQKDNIREYFQ